MKIELIPVRELRPYLNNARTHSRKQIRQIARSIEKFGFCNPVLIDDMKQIIAGPSSTAIAVAVRRTLASEQEAGGRRKAS